MKEISLYTDGACSGNPGPGGWGAILYYGTNKKELSGGEQNSTNNRMELTAVIQGLLALNESCNVNVTTDSKYVVDAVERDWLYGWQRKGWKNSQNKPTPNVDLWEQLLPLLKKHTVTFRWIRGHNGHAENERCDELAVAYSQRLRNV